MARITAIVTLTDDLDDREELLYALSEWQDKLSDDGVELTYEVAP